MALDDEQLDPIPVVPEVNNEYVKKFKLYETSSNFYMVGRCKNQPVWRVLKIDRTEPTDLNITEDPTKYTEVECCDLLNRIQEGNMSTGGLRVINMSYGIVGFIKFLGPYYMLLITKRKKIGVICGHSVYAITKSEIIRIPNSTVQPRVAYSRNEIRYKKILRSVDLTKGFYYSYSYNVTHSFQKKMSTETGKETMYVWNEFLTSKIHNQLENNLWTVQLAYGYFKQIKLSIAEKDFWLTLIARRSRHFAGTRYLKRGVNKKGRVANDVETEQIVFEDVREGCAVQISSVVQNRGSIPLFWSQETSRINLRPDIILSKEDRNYDATRLHFENLNKRYGIPIIILNLVKTLERKPRESILRVEFSRAISYINKDLRLENRLKFLHWDLTKYSKDHPTNVLSHLGKVANHAIILTGFFYCQVIPNSTSQLSRDDNGDHQNTDTTNNDDENFSFKPTKYQKGVLRTNCIDCLDRTNVAQFAYGWAALGRQLHAIGYIDNPVIELDSKLEDHLIRIYEEMGDTIARQYGGSAAQNTIFARRRRQWAAATQSQELLRAVQRYYSNAYMDHEKQDAINVFLGYYQPQIGKVALWEMDSDQHFNVGSSTNSFVERTSFLKRSSSVGDIQYDNNDLLDEITAAELAQSNEELDPPAEALPEITDDLDSTYQRITSTRSRLQVPEEIVTSNRPFYNRDTFRSSNFLDTDWLSSAGNSCAESTLVGFLGDEENEMINSASDSEIIPNVENDINPMECGFPDRSDAFAEWVAHGHMFHTSIIRFCKQNRKRGNYRRFV